MWVIADLVDNKKSQSIERISKITNDEVFTSILLDLCIFGLNTSFEMNIDNINDKDATPNTTIFFKRESSSIGKKQNHEQQSFVWTYHIPAKDLDLSSK